MRKKVRKKPDQEIEKEEVVVVVNEKEKPQVKMTPVEEEQEPMTPLAAASPMKTKVEKN
ncbi:hypothetical protein [Algoriphagus halophilus]|uniref:Uncharacterized protein n=1 Tax=Algoriphagus halophilus TaxID=226505 RepID=A0A1N6GJ18_9BACT|nr:hypothetical protein [Algoriphagus halophilus]SIO07527.1 hypothetical protein SAMN05444394_3291 [Algoriphagus halophilus]